jgi:uncharacterized protein YjbI with pentapeptide repeats
MIIMSKKPSVATLPGITVILLLLAAFFGWLSYTPGNFLDNFASNVSTMLLGVILTAWILNFIIQRREEQLLGFLEGQRQQQEAKQLEREQEMLRAQLVREIASGDAGLAMRALRELDARGWLTDGTLANVYFAGANLPEAKLGWANLSGAYLSRVNLERADLSWANLGGANLNEARLIRATLNLTNLSEANLRGANLSLANLAEANLSSAILDGVVASGATLIEADLNKAHAERGIFSGANLNGAEIVEADFTFANLERANLSGANLGRTNFSKANLENANLSNANLSDANLEEARLQGANLAGAFLLGAKISLRALSATGSLAGATMPDGTKYEEWVDRQSDDTMPGPVFDMVTPRAASPPDYPRPLDDEFEEQ